jgi:hypothetical protein
MSSKWNTNQKLQATPKVCKKTPPQIPLPLQPFQHWPLPAYASWSDSQTPFESLLTGCTVLVPDPVSNRHFGSIVGDRGTLVLTLQYRPLTDDFEFTIALFIGGFYVQEVSVVFDEPKAGIPFETQLFTWDVPGTPQYVEGKILS